MGLLNNVLGAAGFRLKQPEPRQAQRALAPWYAQGQGPTWDRETDPDVFRAFAEKTIRSPADYTAVKRVMDAVGMAGLENLRVVPKSRYWEQVDPLDDHALYDLLNKPNPFTSQFEFFQGVAGWYQVAGNVYIYIHTAQNNEPETLWPLNPGRVEPKISGSKGLTHYTYTINNKSFDLPNDRVMHIKNWNPIDDHIGLPPSEALAVTLATDIAMQKYGWAFFQNGARLSLIIESDRDKVDPEQFDLMRREFEENQTDGPENMHKVMFVWQDFKARELSQNPKDSDFVEGRRINRNDAWQVRGVHPGLITSEDVNRANALVAETNFAKWTVMPILIHIAAQFNMDLMPLYKDNTNVRFVDVVPRDMEVEAEVGVKEANATKALIEALGPEEGVAEAKRKGWISNEVGIAAPLVREPALNGSLRVNGHSPKARGRVTA